MANIIGTSGNDSLEGTTYDYLDTLTGGGGKDIFVYNQDSGLDIITDFGGVGKGTNPSAAVIAEVDTIKFVGAGLSARNLILTQNSTNLEIAFQGSQGISTLVILENFALENLDNLSKSTGASVNSGNIIFDGQTTITDSFDVFNANSTQSTIFNKNTVTFLNDLSNNVNGFDDSDDVINGQGGDDKIDGKSGNDLLRGGVGNDTLIGGAGNNTLNGGVGDDNLIVDSPSSNNLLSGDDGNDTLTASGDQYYNDYIEAGYDLRTLGNNTLNGGAGNDTLSASGSLGDNLLSGGDGNDSVSISGARSTPGGDYYILFESRSIGNNTLNGGAGDDTLGASGSSGDNLLFGGDGNDSLDISGSFGINEDSTYNATSLGDNLLDGGDGNDTLTAFGAVGNNTLNGGNGDDILTGGYGDDILTGGAGDDSLYLSTRSIYSPLPGDFVPPDSVTQTVDGGEGDDVLSVDYSNATGAIASTFNAATNSGEITAGTNRLTYKNIEQFNISGTAYNDNIVGNDGNDTLSTGSSGKDTIDGGNGDDVLSAGYRNATVGVTLTFNAATNSGEITAGTNQVIYKNIERLNISGTGHDDNIVGNDGNDTLSTGSSGKDTIDGGNGDDVLSVNYNSTTSGIVSTFNATTNIGEITVGRAKVSYKNIERLNILGTSNDDNIVGNDGNDTLSPGNTGNDTIDGGKGDDVLSVDYTYLYDGAIASTFNATTNIGEITVGRAKVSYKNIERLNILGTNSSDLIVGSNGNDTLSGGYYDYGNDTIIGGAGNDTLYGGDGTDTFVFNSVNEGLDTIYDFDYRFSATNEVIQVSAAGFGGSLSAGVLLASQFTIGASATTSSERFIYNSTTGALFFDQDGSAGAFSQVQFVQLSTGLSLTNNNFVVV